MGKLDLFKRKLAQGDSRFVDAVEAVPEAPRTMALRDEAEADAAERFSEEKAEAARQIVREHQQRRPEYKGKRLQRAYRLRVGVVKKLELVKALSDIDATEFVEKALDQAAERELKKLRETIDPQVYELTEQRIESALRG